MSYFNVLPQVPPVTLFLETAPVPQDTRVLSANCPAQIKPLERVAIKSVPVPMGTTATMSQEAALGASQTPGDRLAGRTAPARPRARLSAPGRTVVVSARQTSVGQIVKSTAHLGFTGTVAFPPQSMPPAPARPRCFSAILSEAVFAPLASTVGLRLKAR